MTRSLILWVIPMMMCLHETRAQMVDVDPFTGSAVVHVPVWTIKSGTLSYPIAISFSGNGLKAGDIIGPVGAGWTLHAGGFITREVRSLPDDYIDTESAQHRYGWLYDSTAQRIGNFIPAADENWEDCADEESDFEFLDSLGGFSESQHIYDTEPDLFHINVPGLSGSFLFDHQKSIQLITARNFKVEALFSGDTISGFTVINDSGVKYTFESSGTASIGATDVNDENIYVDKRPYYTYRGIIQYCPLWRLTKIESTNGDFISFQYFSPSELLQLSYIGTGALLLYPLSSDPVSILTKGTSSFSEHHQYSISRSPFITPIPKHITTKTQRVEFDLFNKVINTQEYGMGASGSFEEFKLAQLLVEGIRIVDLSQEEAAVLRYYDFDYRVIKSYEGAFTFNGIYLKGIAESSSHRIHAPISFEYYGISLADSTALLSEDDGDMVDEYGFKNTVIQKSQKFFKQFVYPDFNSASRTKSLPVSGYTGSYFETNTAVVSGQVNLPLMMNGSLRQINLPDGGINRIFYEPNTYFDTELDSSVYAAGLRVSRTELHDGIDHQNDIVRSYHYQNDEGHSSGVLLTKPVRAFQLNFHLHPVSKAITYYDQLLALELSEEELWKRLTVVMSNDVAKHNSPFVGYKKVTITQPNAGKTVYEFNVPVPYGGEAMENWTPVRVRIARDTPEGVLAVESCADVGPVGETYGYPFAPRPFVPREGTLSKIKVYNESGNIVQETEHEYVVSVADTVYGIKFDKIKSRITCSTIIELGEEQDTVLQTTAHPMFVYSKYPIHTGIQTHVSKTTKTSYDLGSTTFKVTETQHAEYTGTTHPYLTHTYTISSDSTEFHTKYKYPPDYVHATDTVSGMDNTSYALAWMNKKNIVAIPVEVISYRKKGSVETILSGGLNIFRAHETDPGNYQVNLIKTLSLPPGIAKSSFTESTVENTGSRNFVHDNAYTRPVEMKHFVPAGPQSTLAYNKQKSAVHYHHRLGAVPKVVIANALADEVVFSDFEDAGEFDFTFAASNWGVNNVFDEGRIEGKSLNMLSGASYKITKSFKKGSGLAYTFSCWLKSQDEGILTVTLLDGVHTPVLGTIEFVDSDAAWKFYSIKIPTGTLNENITIQVTTDEPVWMDDAACFPVTASITHYLYGKGLQKIAETTSRGITTRYEYDLLGRITLVRDSENNIVKKFSYSSLWDDDAFSEVKITTPGSGEIYKDELHTFTALWHETTGVTFKWKVIKFTDQEDTELLASLANFSSGVTTVNGSNLLNHTFDSEGIWYLSLQVSNGAYTKVSPIMKVNVKRKPLSVTMCSNRPLLMDVCDPDRFDHSCTPLESEGLRLSLSITEGSGNYDIEWWYMNPSTGAVSVLTGQTGTSITINDFVWSRYYFARVTDMEIENHSAVVQVFFQTYRSNPDCVIPGVE